MAQTPTKNTKIKLVVTDLDGTLLSPDRTISAEAIQAISELKKSNILFSFITGRPVRAIHDFAKQVEITAPIIASNGACLVSADLSQLISGNALDLSPLQPIMMAAVKAGMTVLISTTFDEYSLSQTDWTEIRRQRGQIYQTKDLAEFDQTPVFKVTIINDIQCAEFGDLLPDIERAKARYSVSIYEQNGCEIVAPNTDKETGLKALCEHVSVSLEQVLAIGDNVNDIPMIKAAGIGVAVANAVPELKSVSNYVCHASNTDGVVEAIETFANQGEDRSCS